MSNLPDDLRDDSLLDGLLAELLAGSAPPDQTVKILSALDPASDRAHHGNGAAREPRTNGAEFAACAAPPVISPPVQPVHPGEAAEPLSEPPMQLAPAAPSSYAHRRREAARRRRRMARLAVWIAAVAGVLLVGVTGYFVGRQSSGPASTARREAETGASPAAAGKSNGVNSTIVATPNATTGGNSTGPLPESRAVASGTEPNRNPLSVEGSEGTQRAATARDKTQSPTSPKPESVASDPSSSAPASAGPPSSDAEVIAFINDQLAAAWKVAGVRPAEKASDEEWCRRVFLRIAGRIPTVDELQKFARDRSPGKRGSLVDQLLTKDGYREEYARNFGTIWTNALIGRSPRGEVEAGARAGLQRYLSRQFARNTPYDKLAADLLTACGSNDPNAADYNDAVNFLLASSGERATLATARTSRMFLGMQLQCVQCHSHPFNDLAQNQFWELSAFFRQMKIEPAGNGAFARLTNTDFRGEGDGRSSDAEIYFEQKNGQMKVAYPVFIDGQAIARAGEVSKVNRRAELARLVTSSENLSLALVGRMWATFLEFGFTRPIDDLGPHNPPSHPELLGRLAAEVRRRQYDTQALVRWIVLSDAFSVSSRIGPSNKGDDPAGGGRPLFARYYTRQLQAEEVYQSLMLAVARPGASSAPAAQEQARQLWVGQFARNMNTDEGDEFHVFNGSIPQSLTMMNGELMQHATSGEPGSLLDQIVSSRLSPSEKVSHLFQAAIARRPSDKEQKAAEAILKARGGDQASAFADIWWALLNSNEFILDH